MKTSRVLLTLVVALLACAAAFAQSGDFTTAGKVVDANGPVARATVTYASIGKRLSWDFSDANGLFGGKTAFVVRPALPGASVAIAKAGPVSVDAFEVIGKRLCTLYKGYLDKGTYSFRLPAAFTQGHARSVYVLKIKTAAAESFQKLVLTGTGAATLATATGTVHVSAAKKLAAVDTVRVGKTGYMPTLVAIDAYATDVGTVTLQPVDVETEVTTLFGQMTLAEKEGQLVMPNNAYGGPSVETTYKIGCVFGGGGAFAAFTVGSLADWCDSMQTAAQGTPRKIPMMIGYDGVHGASAVPGATIFPHNLALGAIADSLLVQKAYRVAALEIRGSGANWTYAPCIAVVRDDRWGRTYEGFSESTDLTKIDARHAVLGLQTTDLSLPFAVAGTAKHFAGDGGTANGVNEGTTLGPDSVARAIHLPGFTEAIKAGVATIMPSFSSWCDGVKMHGNKPLLTDWLKTAQKFDGFVVGDWMAQYSVGGTGSCMLAGLDVPMSPMEVGPGLGMLADFGGMYAGTGGPRCDDAVKRVLRVKYRMGLFSNPYKTDRNLTAVFGSTAHRDVARECVRKSLVLLKNANNVLPIPATANVALWGAAANNIGIQCGAWTVQWQGALGNVISGGTTIYQGIQSICTSVTYSADGSNSGNADYIIAFLGENPYAETNFDAISLTPDKAIEGAPSGTDMANTTNASVISNIALAKAAGKKVIVVLIAGRPLDISAVLPNADAFVWACLPGTEGKGIGEVLFRTSPDYNFVGKLPFTWPTNLAQEPINVGDGKTGLFAFGFGLSD
jgi:beta-glucosidase